ncbi:hypothetical protein VXP03_05325 [Acinetobacter baumannii]|uniref:hypothetical protein n=1 Tax=Acinetobacter baumannii TaxID=470 RepID=UPI003A87C71C
MTDLNKERELELFNAFVEENLPELFEKHSNGNFFAKVTYDSMFGAWLGAKAQAVPEHIITLQRNGEVFKFDLLDLLRRSLKSSKVLKTRENWSHVSKMMGLGSTTSTLLCKAMKVDPDGTVFVASESGAEG